MDDRKTDIRDAVSNPAAAPWRGISLLAMIALTALTPAAPAYAGPASEAITVNPIVPLHKMNKDEIARIRKAKVAEYNRFRIYPETYAPDPVVYGMIDEQADWVNDTQFFVANPYLLVLTSAGSMVNPLLPYCGEVGVEHSGNRINETYRGEAAKKWFTYQYDYYPDSKGIVRLWFVNALDAGFKYAYVDPSRSTNIEPINGAAEDHVMNSIYAPKEFFHRGRQGKNNISPDDARAKLKLKNRDERTVIHIKLWNDRPGSVEAREDLAYVIEIEPSPGTNGPFGFNYSSYKLSSLVEIGAYATALGNQHEGGFEFFANKYKVRAAIKQYPVPISSYIQTALNYHSKSIRFLKPEHLKMFTHQLDLKEDDYSFVLVFQEQLVPFLKQDVQPGENIDLYTVLAVYDCT